MDKLWMITFLSGCALLGLATSCQPDVTRPKVNAEESAEKKADATTAVAIIRGTQGNRVKGEVTFTVVDGGVKVVADFDGLKPGKHGFHIHEFGSCASPDGSSAGGHFNPDNQQHSEPDSEHRHAGDLGNVEANQQGHAHYERIDKVIQLNGPAGIIGRSVIIHAEEDDFKTQPTGNSGARLGCGIIEAR